MGDPIDPASREAVARDLARSILTAESMCGFNETETMIWMHLGENPDGLSAASIAGMIGRDDKTVRRRLEQMVRAGLVERDRNIRRLTAKGWQERTNRFEACWEHYPQDVKNMIVREAEIRKRRAKP